MSKGQIYKYELKTGHITECTAVYYAYTQAGWIFKELCPESGVPTHLIFEWPKDCAAYYPGDIEI